jgi:ferritin-like protein
MFAGAWSRQVNLCTAWHRYEVVVLVQSRQIREVAVLHPETYQSASLLWSTRLNPPTKEKLMANEGYHEPTNELKDATRDMHRAIVSLMEELEAVDWYNQRVDACQDPVLRSILAHNRDEEKEHAAMLMEWIRRNDGSFEKEMRDYLFTDKPLTHD